MRGVGPVSIIGNKQNLFLNGYIFEYNQMLSSSNHIINKCWAYNETSMHEYIYIYIYILQCMSIYTYISFAIELLLRFQFHEVTNILYF
jgi:hypothetical protein